MLRRFYNLYTQAVRHTYRYGVLCQSNTGVVLTITTDLAALAFLQESIPDTFYSPSVNYPNYVGYFFLLEMPPDQYPEWMWNGAARSFEGTKRHLLTDSVRSLSALAHKKSEVMSTIMGEINESRRKVGNGLFFQDRVYLMKENQARDFSGSGYNENDILKYPYVLQYADYKNISLRQAADDILLKAQIANDHLAKTELLRLKYFDKVRGAQAVDDLERVRSDFIRECYVNAQV